MIEKKLIKINIEQLIPYENNAKQHGSNIEVIKKSIERNEYVSPIIIDEKNIIIAGHGRRLALLELNIKEIEVLQVKGLTDKQKADLRISDNRIAEFSTWDYEMVFQEIKDFGLEELQIDFTHIIDDNNEDFEDFRIPENEQEEGKPKKVTLSIELDTNDEAEDLKAKLEEEGYKVFIK